MKERTRKIIVYIATSADGYIARLDGSVGWLDRPRPQGDYDMSAFLRSIDTVIWGRKTYDQKILISSFLDEGAIDEFMIHVVPVFIGQGIPLIAPRHGDVPLTLLSSKNFTDGVVRLHYHVG